jgi:hypothetical protein
MLDREQVPFDLRHGGIMRASMVRIKNATWLGALAVPTMALGESVAVRSDDYLEEIIVTAQKWEHSANKVEMSITAVLDELCGTRRHLCRGCDENRPRTHDPPSLCTRSPGQPATYGVGVSARF